MGKNAWGCLGAAAAPFLLYAAWISYPPSYYEKEMQQRLAQRAAGQAIAADSRNNAYMNPNFLPFWGRPTSERRPGMLAETQIKKLEPLSDLSQGKEVNLENRLSEPKVRRTFAEFARFYPVIHKMCSQSSFIVPDQPQTTTGVPVTPDIIAMRSIPMNLSAYAEYLSLSRKPEAALEVALDSLRFSHLLRQDLPPLTQASISLACQSIAQSTLARVLLEGTPDLTDALETLKSTQLPADFYAQCLEGEMVMFLQDGRYNSTGGLQPPGLWEREKRLYKNDLMQAAQQSRNGKPATYAWATNMTSSSWLLGQHSYLSAVLLPNVGRTEIHIQRIRMRQAFIHLYVAVLQARQSHGRAPANLAELHNSGYHVLEGLDLKRVSYLSKGAEFWLSLSLRPGEEDFGFGSDDLAEWNAVNGAEWKLKAGQQP